MREGENMVAMGGGREDPLRRRIYVDSSYREFGAVSAREARAQAAALAEAGSWGPLAKVAGVAQAWRELAADLEAAGPDATVSSLGPAARERYVRRLWVEPPGGSLL